VATSGASLSELSSDESLSDESLSEEPLSEALWADESPSELSSAMAGTATAIARTQTIPITVATRAETEARQPRVPRCLPIPVLPAESRRINETTWER
jgi:hypothetical protein